jgi:hypothetical protein
LLDELSILPHDPDAIDGARFHGSSSVDELLLLKRLIGKDVNGIDDGCITTQLLLLCTYNKSYVMTAPQEKSWGCFYFKVKKCK